ncbi:Sperm acrosome-associated protein 5 [Plecturocebus cupreus]
MVVTVDAKIYERCELAAGLETAGLNGYKGYSVGDCENPLAPNPVHTLSHSPHSDSGTPLSFITSPGQGMIPSVTHSLTVLSSLTNSNVTTIIAFTTVTSISAVNTITTINIITAVTTMNTITTTITDPSPESPTSPHQTKITTLTTEMTTFPGYLCMAHYESGFDTAFVDHNPDGSSEYGIFLLNSAWWCDNGITPTKNLCHMDCRDLLNRHILDGIMCAKQIVSSQNGLSAWQVHEDSPDHGQPGMVTSWRRHCSGHDLSEWLKGCAMRVKIDPKNYP